MASLFVSDLHLSPRRPQTADLFLSFLAGRARRARRLFILGDLFDYWLGDDALNEPFSRHVADGLAALVAANVATFFLPGNRDFLVGADFATATSLHLLDDGSVWDVGGQATLLLHGDTLCTDDHDYQTFRTTVRSPAWRDEFLARPLEERRQYVENLRQRSETEKQVKANELMDVNADTVVEAFRRNRVSRMIHGHTHRQARHDLTVDGRHCERWVLGEWGVTGNCLCCAGPDWAFETVVA